MMPLPVETWMEATNLTDEQVRGQLDALRAALTAVS